MQTLMKFKTFTWPNNPTTCHVTQGRRIVQHQYLDGTWCTQEFGNAPRVYSGEGVFFGASAVANFHVLLSLFRTGGMGMLRHPHWGTINVYPQELEYTLEPEEQCIHYRFSFLEAPV